MVSRRIDRRHFLCLACGGAAFVPLALRAKDGVSLVVGFLDPRPSAAGFSDRFAGFHLGRTTTLRSTKD
ncbi:hypothetical protein [Bradyrhizobium neotropicale]|uniref:Uncharacterized protein n=1 Tax=Bradyrhizobium neotropicale TaxID=1497615 RepID=A0A176Z791_9BRAD|nr:hypothetical protein [Bradyrhizobium neotropicale]OAF16600.1 hypothetical protein AXW67_12145 [Bradyrhizobium neotropicale]